jgi:biotin carboxyl carrier protein
MPPKAIFELALNQSAVWELVSVEQRDGHAVVGLAGHSLTVDSVELSPGAYSLVVEGGSYDVTVTGVQGKYLVSVDGTLFEIRLRDPRKLRSPTASTNDSMRPLPVAAPMPGKVVKLLVSEGEPVSEGQAVAVIEAMKMQNELRAPRAGQVEGITVVENQSVNAGESLMMVR